LLLVDAIESPKKPKPTSIQAQPKFDSIKTGYA